jgi:hypothetical protein
LICFCCIWIDKHPLSTLTTKSLGNWLKDIIFWGSGTVCRSLWSGKWPTSGGPTAWISDHSPPSVHLSAWSALRILARSSQKWDYWTLIWRFTDSQSDCFHMSGRPRPCGWRSSPFELWFLQLSCYFLGWTGVWVVGRRAWCLCRSFPPWNKYRLANSSHPITWFNRIPNLKCQS